MADYSKMARDAAKRRKVLVAELDRARSTVTSCENEMKVLDQILDALKGAGGRRGRGAKAGAKKRGKWRPGRPGRPPKWWVEQQKKAGKGGARKPGRRKRRGRKPGRKRAARKAPAPTAAAPAPAPAM